MLTLIEAANHHLTLTPLQRSYLQRLALCSPFMARKLSKNLGLLEDVLANIGTPYDVNAMQTFIAKQKITDEETLKRALRQLRQAVLARIILRDLNGLADLSEVMQTISVLAEYAIKVAIGYLHPWQVEVNGQPQDANGNPQSLVVVGMGKLGGAELNVSSDIDLIFAYEQEGETDGKEPITNQRFFVGLAKKLISALHQVTEDGFVFRVDMDLRPFGREGALVTSLDALEEYYQNNGREWERYAWVKGHELTGGNAIYSLLKPFVYRKYLDYGAFSSMRDLKVQIQREANIRSSKHGHDNIKVGRGGIREVEFIAQVFQLIRGGKDISLQIRPTLQVLNLLKEKHILQDEVVSELSVAYVFLRNLEHRLMYVEDAQTQDLPKHEDAQSRIATAMDFENWTDLMLTLNQHRQRVQAHFDETFKETKTSDSGFGQAPSEAYINAKAIWNGELDNDGSTLKLSELGFTKTENTFEHIQQLHQSHRYKQLPELSRQRFNVLLPLLIEVASQQANADIALLRTLDFIEAICRRASYLALLAEHPAALRLVVHLCGTSAWCAQYLTRHPIVLDELLDEHTLYAAPDFVAMQDDLVQKMQRRSGDIEQQMDAMRHFKHAAIFRFAAQDVSGRLALETLSDYLSALAGLILDVSIQTIWQSLNFKHADFKSTEQPKFAVIGYGKLGGKEISYSSDLDVIFLFDDDTENASEVYGRFAQRISSWFSTLTAAGLLYEIDLQLRPDGNSGLLVSSVKAFDAYQFNRAWVWEHQAITRARFVTGDAAIGKAFEAVRIKVIKQVRDVGKLRSEVVEMRTKMRESYRTVNGMFDLKKSAGGIIDVEFIVQYLVLVHASQYDALTQNVGNIALLSMLGKLEVIDKVSANKTADAYRKYRRLQHAASLQEDAQAVVEVVEVEVHAKAVVQLWQHVFESSLA